MATKTKAAPQGRRGASGKASRGATDSSKYHKKPHSATSSAPGEIQVYDGRDYRGAVLAQAGRYVAYDQHGHRISHHPTEREATRAVYEHQAARRGGGR